MSAIQHDRNLHTVARNGTLLWNGRGVDEDGMAWLLADVPGITPQPQVEFRPHAAAAYDRTAHVLRLVEDLRIGNFGFSGKWRFRSVGR